jgi:hypothetical protein
MPWIKWADGVIFTSSGVNNYHNVHERALTTPHASHWSSFHWRYSINIWAGNVDCYPNETCVILVVNCLSDKQYADFLERTFPLLLVDVPFNVHEATWFHHDGVPIHFSCQQNNWLSNHFLNIWISTVVQMSGLCILLTWTHMIISY